jgi:hypothetical protein
MKTYSNLLTQEEIQELLSYHYLVDERIDARPDVVSKHPRWDIDTWPQHIVESVLNQVLDYNYTVEEVIFNQSRISFRIHADSGDGNSETLGHAVLIPLLVNGPSATVFFDNYWHGASTKFSKILIKDFEYNLIGKNGQWVYIEDLRTLLNQCLYDPDSVEYFDIDQALIQNLEYLIAARNNQAISKRDNRCYDYSTVVNYQEHQLFPADIHQKYLSHIPIESCHGLTIDQIVDWIIGNAIVFDRTQLHCAASGHQEKIGITVFVRRLLNCG